MKIFRVILFLLLLVVASPAIASDSLDYQPDAVSIDHQPDAVVDHQSDSAVHEEEEQPGIFGKYPGEYIWTLVWFGVLLGVLWKFAWKPLLGGLQARTDHIAKQISDAQKKVDEGKKVLAEYNDKLAGVEAEGRQIIAARTKQAEKQGQQIIEQAQKEVEQIRLKAETDIERARAQATDDLWKQTGDILVKLGSEVLGKSMDEEDNKKLIDEAIDRFKSEEAS